MRVQIAPLLNCYAKAAVSTTVTQRTRGKPIW